MILQTLVLRQHPKEEQNHKLPIPKQKHLFYNSHYTRMKIPAVSGSVRPVTRPKADEAPVVESGSWVERASAAWLWI